AQVMPIATPYAAPHLPESASGFAPPPQAPAAVFAPPSAGMMPAPISLDDRVREFESSLIRWALRVTHGNKSRAAALLQIKRSTLGDRIVRCGLNEVPAEKAPEQVEAAV